MNASENDIYIKNIMELWSVWLIHVSGVKFVATQAPSVYDKVTAMEPMLRPVVSLNLTMY
jgi:hypothetical protein